MILEPLDLFHLEIAGIAFLFIYAIASKCPGSGAEAI